MNPVQNSSLHIIYHLIFNAAGVNPCTNVFLVISETMKSSILMIFHRVFPNSRFLAIWRESFTDPKHIYSFHSCRVCNQSQIAIYNLKASHITKDCGNYLPLHHHGTY